MSAVDGLPQRAGTVTAPLYKTGSTFAIIDPAVSPGGLATVVLPPLSVGAPQGLVHFPFRRQPVFQFLAVAWPAVPGAKIGRFAD
jgi:hypothetical protein